MTFERAHSHATRTQNSTDDHDLAPGRASIASRLDAPVDPIASGLTRTDLFIGETHQAGTTTQTGPVAPRTFTEHVAGPPVFDFGKVSPGGVERIGRGIVNLTSADCTVQVSYSGSTAISLVHQPTRLLPKGSPSAIDQTVKLQFNAPATKGTHTGTVTASVWWFGGPAPETLTIPVIAHSLDISDLTSDEKIAREEQAKRADTEGAEIAKRKTKEEAEFEEFSRKPFASTPKFEGLKDKLKIAATEIEHLQLSAVSAAHDEVMKFERRPPPQQSDTRLFDFAMLVLDIVSAGVAGKLGKALELGLRASAKGMAEATRKGIAIKLSESTISAITDSVKEAIKSSSRRARQEVFKKPLGDGDEKRLSGNSTDPRIRFFQRQRDGFIHGFVERSSAATNAAMRLLPSLHTSPDVVYAALENMVAAFEEEAKQVSAVVAHESVRQWINLIAQEHLGVHRAGTRDSKPINEIDGVIDIGFQAPAGPKSPIVVKRAIIRGVSDSVASRFQRIPLRDAKVPIRAYGLPGGMYAELPVSVLYRANGQVDWQDETNGLAPATEATWLRAKGGAKLFMEQEIVHKSLEAHGVVLTTDQDKERW